MFCRPHVHLPYLHLTFVLRVFHYSLERNFAKLPERRAVLLFVDHFAAMF